MKSSWIAIGAAWGALAIALGAFGAHGLRDRASAPDLEIWKTGVLYHALTALVLIAFGLYSELRGARSAPGLALFIGSVIFSGTLYAMVLGAPRWLGAVTPIGGVAMIGGWVLFASQAWRARRPA